MDNKAKKQLTESDIISKFIMPAVEKAGWDSMLQIRQEVKLRDGKVIVRGNVGMRKTVKSVDIVLYYKPSMPLAVIEAKANKHEIGKGIQQGLDYARLLDVPFVFSSNGDGFIFHDKTAPANGGLLETQISLEDFPTPQALKAKLNAFNAYTPEQLSYLEQDYYDDGTDKAPRYYQLKAVNKTIEAISRGEKRILLVMATGVGKTYTAFQIAWRLWKAKKAKRLRII
jgi:type I restriction enzyme R subunit